MAGSARVGVGRKRKERDEASSDSDGGSSEGALVPSSPGPAPKRRRGPSADAENADNNEGDHGNNEGEGGVEPGADDVVEVDAEEPEPLPLPPELLAKWLHRQKIASLRLIAGERPALAARTPQGPDPHATRLVGLRKQYDFLRQTVHGTLVLRASNSIAVLGPSGSGKHALLEATLDSVVEEMEMLKPKADKAAGPASRPYFHVRLDGALQPTDSLLLRALARQLVEQGAFDESDVSELIQRDDAAAAGTTDEDEERGQADNGEDEVDDEQQRLNLLGEDAFNEDEDEDQNEHDDEHDEESDDEDSGLDEGERDNVLGPKARSMKNRKKDKDAAIAAERDKLAVQQALFTSISSATKLILSLLATPLERTDDPSTGSAGPVLSKPLIVSLSNLDTVATRDPQAILYCLLDAVQASSYAPGLLFVGLSARPDVDEMMEKRVKSRFSHRMVHVFPVENIPTAQAAAAAAAERAAAKRKAKGKEAEWLLAEEEEAEEDVTVLDIVRQVLMATIPGPPSERSKEKEERALWTGFWTAKCEKFLQDDRLTQALQKLWDSSNNVNFLFQVLRPVIASLDAGSSEPPHALLDPAHFERALAQRRLNATEAILRSLTLPELALLVTARHLSERGKTIFNFEMCWDGLGRWVAEQQQQQQTPSGASPYGEQVRQLAAGAGEERGRAGRQDRLKAKNAFKSLLELELFIPDAALNTLGMTSLAGGLGGLSASRKGSLLRDEVVPVRCQLEVGHIAGLLKEMLRRPGMAGQAGSEGAGKGKGREKEKGREVEIGFGPGFDQRFASWALGNGL